MHVRWSPLAALVALLVTLATACSDDASSAGDDASDATGDVPTDTGDAPTDPIPDLTPDADATVDGGEDSTPDVAPDALPDVEDDGATDVLDDTPPDLADDTGGDAALDGGDDAGNDAADVPSDAPGDVPGDTADAADDTTDTGADPTVDAVEDTELPDPCGNETCEPGLGESWNTCTGDCADFCGDGLCDPTEQASPGDCPADCQVTVVFEIDMRGLRRALPGLDNPPSPGGTGVAFIAGNQDVWGPWIPNHGPAAFVDNGVAPDRTANDNLWTRGFDFARGTALEYKYTFGTVGADWGGTEEYPGGNNRGYTVPSDGTRTVRVRDVFGDQPTSAATLGRMSATAVELAACTFNEVCDLPYEASAYCPSECECGDDACDPFEQYAPGGLGACAVDCGCDANFVCETTEVIATCVDCDCNYDGTCDIPQENSQECANDCNCGDGICDPHEATDPVVICPDDCGCGDDDNGFCTFEEAGLGCPGADCEACNFNGDCDLPNEDTLCDDC